MGKSIEYYDDDVLLEGYYVSDSEEKKNKPVVLVVHDWSGKNEFAIEKAKALAKLGYVGFAIDMYGKGKIGKTKEEKTQLIQPFIKNRDTLQKRILAAFATAKTLPEVDANKIGAIGFCFGGLCVLDLARSGADVKGVVSFHGLLNAPENTKAKKIVAKILATHGYDDPMVSPKDVNQFAEEMTNAKADWQIIMYGHAMHAFTNPDANDPGFGTVYNKKADERSWIAMVNFFDEVFG